jgi:RNA polymerase sigma-70 factor (ECF subfamily)
VSQRSAVILRDVLGYYVQEVADVIGGSLPAAKAALQRGRLRLRELAREPEDLRLPALAEPEAVAFVLVCQGASKLNGIGTLL